MIRKHYTRLLRAILSSLLISSAFVVAAGEPALMTDEMLSNQERTVIDQLRNTRGRLKELMHKINVWERNEGGTTSMGAIGIIQLKAENFAIERQNRKKIGMLAGELSELIEKLLIIRDQTEQLKLANKISAEADQTDLSDHQPDPLPGQKTRQSAKDITNFEYYEVKEDSDLKEISQLDDVYGDPGYWEILYNANQDRLMSPDQKIVAGTVLVIPNLHITRDFEF